MNSSTTSRFRAAYRVLPASVRKTAVRQFRLWMADPRHPSLHFKKVGPFWSARVGSRYRALAALRGETYYWFWIGPHAEYDEILARQ